MKKKTVARLACVVPLLAGGASAWSSATTTATLTDFRVELVDLDPGDGIAPSLVFDPYGTSTSQSDVYRSTPGVASLDQYGSGTDPFAPVASATTSGLATSSAALVGDAFGAGAIVSSSAQTSAWGGYSISDSEVGFANQVEAHRFTLSPGTELVISGDATFSASAAHDQATEQADSGLFLFIGDDSANFASNDSWISAGVYADQSTTHAQTSSTTFRIFYDNTSSQAYAGTVGGYLGSYATSDGRLVGAVPEPAMPALILAGAGIVAWRGRRRSAA